MHDPCKCKFNRYKIRLINLLTARHVIAPTQIHVHHTISGHYTVMPWQAYQCHPPLNWFYNTHWHHQFAMS